MSERPHLDTHVVIRLASGDLERVPGPLLERRVTADLVVSPVVRLERDLLHERSRITSPASDVIDKVSAEVGVREDDTALARLVMAAIAPRKQGHNGDPYDRLIFAAAIADHARLVIEDASHRGRTSRCEKH